MVTSRSARAMALTDQVLAALTAEAPLPVSTPRVHAAVSPPCDGYPHKTCAGHVLYSDVYRILNMLARSGEVEKWPPGEDRRTCLWRRLTGPVVIP